MPLYEYRCESCGKSEEVLESMSAPVEHDCPACGIASGMKRQVSVPSFALTGGGWHANDYCKSKECPAESPAKAPEKPTGGCCGGCCHGH